MLASVKAVRGLFDAATPGVAVAVVDGTPAALGAVFVVIVASIFSAATRWPQRYGFLTWSKERSERSLNRT
jgi:hypothetical protein